MRPKVRTERQSRVDTENLLSQEAGKQGGHEPPRQEAVVQGRCGWRCRGVPHAGIYATYCSSTTRARKNSPCETTRLPSEEESRKEFKWVTAMRGA